MHGKISLFVKPAGAEDFGLLQKIDPDNELTRKGAMTRARNAQRHWQENYHQYRDAQFKIVEETND